MWNLKYNTSESIYETKTDSDIESRLVVARGGGGRRREGLGVWDYRCELSHIEWINNEVLLYSTGNYAIMKKNICV